MSFSPPLSTLLKSSSSESDTPSAKFHRRKPWKYPKISCKLVIRSDPPFLRRASTFAVSFTQESTRHQTTDSKLDNANLQAQTEGKVPELCEPGSAFNNYVDACNQCISRYADQAATSGRQYFDDSISQYISYCDSIPTTTAQSTATVPTSWLRYYETFEPLTLSNLDISGASTASSTVLYKGINITSTVPAYFFHVAVQSLVSSYVPSAVFSEFAASAASAASVASITGDGTSLIYAALEDTSRPPWFSSAIPSTYAAEFSTLDASVNELRATPVSTASGSEATSTPGAASTPGATATPGATSTGT